MTSRRPQPIFSQNPKIYLLEKTENQKYSGTFRWYKMETLARNGLTETYITSFEADKTDKHLRLNFCAKTVSGL